MEYEDADRIAKRCLEEYDAESEAIRSLQQIKVFHEPKDYDEKLKAIVEFTDNLKARAAEAIKKRDEVRSVINSIPGIEGEILRARHVDGLGWEEIADKYYYSLSGVFKLYDRCLKIVQDMLDNAAGQ